jgi:hypothetical protein
VRELKTYSFDYVNDLPFLDVSVGESKGTSVQLLDNVKGTPTWLPLNSKHELLFLKSWPSNSTA